MSLCEQFRRAPHSERITLVVLAAITVFGLTLIAGGIPFKAGPAPERAGEITVGSIASSGTTGPA